MFACLYVCLFIDNNLFIFSCTLCSLCSVTFGSPYRPLFLIQVKPTTGTIYRYSQPSRHRDPIDKIRWPGVHILLKSRLCKHLSEPFAKVHLHDIGLVFVG